MEITNKNIEEYIRRFMEGETTNAEEQAIYRFFRTGKVPEHLKSYTEMFTWYEEGMPEEKMVAPTEVSKPLWKRIPMELWSMGIAATLVVGIGLGIILSFNESTSEEWACYEGSYVAVKGKRITDVEKIMPIILETLAEAEAIEKGIEERLADIKRTEKEIAEREELLLTNN